ncbi:MAG: universal stress protein [Desulfuromonadales bacterium]|nr:universal stress protein [Desulfuromonadales bacterium]
MKNRKILVPLDGSPLSAQTIRSLIALKENIPVPLTLLHVLDLSTISYQGFAEKTLEEIEEKARDKARNLLNEQQKLFTDAGMEVETLLKEGDVRETICAVVDSDEYDLLVIGKHTDSELRNLLFDQISNYLVHHVKCPVLIV